MATSAEAYVDTSALIAFADRSDSWHPLFRRLFSDPPRLVTTTLVVAEGHGWFLKRYDRIKALQFLAMVETMRPLIVLPVGPREIEAASALLRRFRDRDLTLVDACGLHAMEAEGVRCCWSADCHLGLTGFPLVIHER